MKTKIEETKQGNNKEYAAALALWVDSLQLTGKSGRRAVFVERSLKRQFKKNIAKSLLISRFAVPHTWKGTLEQWHLQTLWNITNTVATKFKTTVPEEFKFRMTLNSL